MNDVSAIRSPLGHPGKARRPLVALAQGTALAALLALAGCGGFQGPATPKPTADVETATGNYLAARQAGRGSDAATSLSYLKKVLETDPLNADLLDETLVQAVVAGEAAEAQALAQRLIAIDPARPDARTTLGFAALKAGRAQDAINHFDQVKDGPGFLLAAFGKAWSLAELGRTEDALTALDRLGGRPSLDPIRRFHRGLVLDLSGQNTAAYNEFTMVIEKGQATIRVVDAYASLLARQGRLNDAKRLVGDLAKANAPNPQIELLAGRLIGPKPDARFINSATDGAAEALYGIGASLGADRITDLALLHLRTALVLKPDFDLVRINIAEVLEDAERFEEANREYSAISKDSPLRPFTDLQIPRNLARDGKVDEAIAAFKALAAGNPGNDAAEVALADLLREKERFAEAAEVLDRVIARITTPKPQDWTLYFSRGVSRERVKRWPEAEADLQMALKLNPDQPVVLNYLGYTWVEQGVRLDEARRMIEKAVSLRPNDGYIVDSLGWLLYKMGDYAGAVRELERAVQLRPQDPTINDHLGDAYWMAGRRTEAKFQWSHALATKPAADAVAAIQRKLEVGLEAPTPISAAQNRTAPKPGP